VEHRSLMRFDYAHESIPDVLDRLRATRLPEECRTPAWALVTALLVVLAALPLEHYRVASAQHDAAQARMRLDRARERLARLKLARVRVDEMLALDQRIRTIRLSGSVLCLRLADVANHVPSKAWLTSLTQATDGTSIAGRAEGLDVLSETLADLMSSTTAAAPSLVRAGRDANIPGVASLLSFELHAVGRRP
jgi:Tfp pilus assembly protein PilN